MIRWIRYRTAMRNLARVAPYRATVDLDATLWGTRVALKNAARG